jgi:N-acetylmuramoyl-L-alanine amidase
MLKRDFVLQLSLFFLCSAIYSQNIKIKIVYPNEHETLFYSKEPTFVIGTVSPPSAKVFVNGVAAKVEKDGAFMAIAPVAFLEKERTTISGRDTLRLNASFTCVAKYNGLQDTLIVYALAPAQPRTSRSDMLLIDTTYSLQPDVNLTLRPQELLTVEFKGTPNCTATFDIAGYTLNIPMAETAIVDNYYWGEAVFGGGQKATGGTIHGIYRGECILPDAALTDAKITFHLKNDRLGESSREAKGKLTIDNSRLFRVIEFTDSVTIARSDAGLGYELFIPRGVKATATGKKGGWIRLRMAASKDVWVPISSVKELPIGTPPPRSTLEVVRTTRNKEEIEVKFALHEKIPYKIDQSTDPQSLTVTLYGVTSDLDWIRHDFGEPLIRDITWSQEENEVLRVRVNLNTNQQWGYTAKYDGTNFLLSIKRPPKIASKSSALRGRVICLDPGHTPEPGAIGPRGTHETDVNLKISLQLEKMLEASGAKVYLTHAGNPLPLRQRSNVVVGFNPDIMVSIHNNAVPDGVDPRVWNGSSTYYYHPQAYRLAYDIQDAITKDLKLTNFGLYWDNLYMCRIHETVSVLVEPAFMIVPEQEALLLREAFQKKVAMALHKGITKFFQQSISINK